MNTSKRSSDVFALMAVAQANWPHDPVAGSEAVWTKWSDLLRSFPFEEVRAALDSLVRSHPRLPSLAELLGELKGRRATTIACNLAEPVGGRVPLGGAHRSPPIDLDADYVIGPYTAAFAEMNAGGWTTERLIRCIRTVETGRP